MAEWCGSLVPPQIHASIYPEIFHPCEGAIAMGVKVDCLRLSNVSLLIKTYI